MSGHIEPPRFLGARAMSTARQTFTWFDYSFSLPLPGPQDRNRSSPLHHAASSASIRSQTNVPRQSAPHSGSESVTNSWSPSIPITNRTFLCGRRTTSVPPSRILLHLAVRMAPKPEKSAKVSSDRSMTTNGPADQSCSTSPSHVLRSSSPRKANTRPPLMSREVTLNRSTIKYLHPA